MMMRQYRGLFPGDTWLRMTTLASVLLSCLLSPISVVSAWGNSNEEDVGIFGNALNRDWLDNSKAISIQLEGCLWGYVDDNEDAGCMEDGSEDGTTYWYQMANCRRAQAVFSLYAGNSASCSSSNFKESFVTTAGLSEFIYYLSVYDQNNPFGDNVNYNDDDNADDNVWDGSFDDIPMCEQGNYGYIGLGCADDGTFSLQYFDDQYCLQPSGKTYDKLQSLNKALKTYKNCAGIYYSGNNNGGYSLPYYLISAAESCSSLDSAYCTDTEAMKERHSGSSNRFARSATFSAGKTWVTKLKYATGGLLLLASFIMFTGILFTNRRRRRALLQRKYRLSKSERSRRKSGRSKSKPRKSSRSRSRAREGDDGAFA